LIHAALALIRNNMNFAIIGKNFSDDLVDHVREITGKGLKRQVIRINDLASRLIFHMDEKEKQWRQDARKQGDLKELKETTEALTEVLGYLAESEYKDEIVHMDVKNSDDFVEYLKKRFSGIDADTSAKDAEDYEKQDPKARVILTTAHRSKGLEFHRVFILRNDLFPHASAKTDEEKEQEENARYVSYTRATHALHVLNDTEPGGKKKK
jgi:superfamily I DNA/RNA helicase